MPACIAHEAQIVRSICHESFYAFVQEFWHVVVPEKPAWGWHIKYLCDTFQADAERVFAGQPKLHDTIVNISPGTTKSTILSIMAPAWVHARRPDMRVLCGSHTANLTFELGRKCRMVEESPLYQAAFPEVVPSKDQWAKSLFMNTKGGGRVACTVGGMSPTGFHAHFIIIDDPLDPQEAGSAADAARQTANNFMAEVLPSRKVDKEVTVTWLIMQRLHQNDPTGYLLTKHAAAPGAIRHINLPAIRNTRVRPRHLRKHYVQPPGCVDHLMDPVRLNYKVLEEAKKALGEYGYCGQFLQHPVPRGGGMFKPDQISIGTPPPLNAVHIPGRADGWVRLCRGWDKAGTSGGGAYTVGFLLGRYRRGTSPADGSLDEWWILDIVRQQLDSGARERLITQTAARDGKRTIVAIEQEPGSGGKESAQATCKRLAGYRTKIIVASSEGSKEDRADNWSALVNQGAYHMAAATWNATLLEEMRFFPLSTYKDQVDAGSVAFAGIEAAGMVVGAM